MKILLWIGIGIGILASLLIILHLRVRFISAQRESLKNDFLTAGRNGDSASVRKLIKKGVDIESRTPPKYEKDKAWEGYYYFTPLMIAATKGNMKIAKILVENKAEVNASDLDHITALMLAVSKGDEQMAGFLIDHGADVNMFSKSWATALMLAAAKGDSQIAKLLMDKGADVNAEKVKAEFANAVRRRTNIHSQLDFARMAKLGPEETFDFVFDNLMKMDPDKAFFRPPLLWAIDGRHSELVALLLERGADLNWTLESDCPPFIQGAKALMFAAYYGDVNVVDVLLEKGADVNAKDNPGNSALIYAAYNGNVDAIAHLIKRGADVNVKNGMNMSALWVAIERGHIEAIKFLVKVGADKTRIEGRETALMFAIKSKQKDSIDALIELGSDVNEKDSNGITALIIAAARGILQTVKLLVNLGADVNAAVDVESEHNGKTALIWAAEGGYIDVVRFLIDKGADVNARTKKGETALHRASAKGFVEIVEILKKAGAK